MPWNMNGDYITLLQRGIEMKLSSQVTKPEMSNLGNFKTFPEFST